MSWETESSKYWNKKTTTQKTVRDGDTVAVHGSNIAQACTIVLT